MSSLPTGGPVLPSHSLLRPLGPDEVVITGGFWAQKQTVNAEATLAHCLEWMERIGWIGNFDRAANGTIADAHAGIEFVDSEVYKLLEAMAWELGRRLDPELSARYESLVARVAAAQEPDGYLHTSFGRASQPPRYSNMEFGHELYCYGHLIQAAVARLRTGHDDALPAVARRVAEHLYAEFGPEGRSAVCGHPEVEMALVELSRATGESRYLELARLFIERRGAKTLVPPTIQYGSEYFQDEQPVREARTMRGHAVRALYLASGALDVATETGDLELADAVKQQWANGVARRTYITGAVGSHHQDEAFGEDFELPADRAYAETCAGIASVMFSWRLLLQTGDTKYADLIERTLYNNVLASPRQDGRAFYYANTLHQRHPGAVPDEHELSHRAESSLRAPWFEVSCCPTNVARTLASIGMYFATVSEDGIQLHQYGDYDVRTQIGNQELHVQVASDYPFSGRVTLTVLEAPDAAVAVRARIPAWARNGELRTSEEPSVVASDSIEFRRVFRAGDAIELDLPFETATSYGDPRIDAVRGAFAVERGPLVMALESVDLPEGWNVNDIVADPASVAVDEGGVSLSVSRLAVTEQPWPYRGEPGGGVTDTHTAKLVPYFMWANRGPSTMRVWIPELT